MRSREIMGKSHCDRYLNGLVFVFDEDVRRRIALKCTLTFTYGRLLQTVVFASTRRRISRWGSRFARQTIP